MRREHLQEFQSLLLPLFMVSLVNVSSRFVLEAVSYSQAPLYLISPYRVFKDPVPPLSESLHF
jgi:hypothetical protein